MPYSIVTPPSVIDNRSCRRSKSQKLTHPFSRQIKALSLASASVLLGDRPSTTRSGAPIMTLAPIPPERRTWGTYNFASLWISMAVCIPTYMLASGLIAGGMNWWQAIITILLGNLIVLVPMVLNAHAGTKYGIPFPVLVRASFGVRGANIPAVLRALVACGWFGIQTWIGGAAIYSMLKIMWPAIAGMAGGVWLCFFG